MTKTIIKTKTLSPVIERAIRLNFAEIAEDVFQQGLLDWEQFFKEIHPASVHQETGEWKFKLTSQGAIDEPKVDSNSAICKIKHRFWSSDFKNKETQPIWCVQIERNYFTLNLRKTLLEQEGNYTELLEYFKMLISKFINIFGDLKLESVTLSYWVLLDYLRIQDESLAKSDWLEVNKMMTIFKKMPEPENSVKYVAPYLCQQNWEAKCDDELYSLSINTTSLEKEYSYPCLRVHFAVVKHEVFDSSLTKSLNNMYIFIKDLFDISFTADAKKILKRY